MLEAGVHYFFKHVIVITDFILPNYGSKVDFYEFTVTVEHNKKNYGMPVLWGFYCPSSFNFSIFFFSNIDIKNKKKGTTSL